MSDTPLRQDSKTASVPLLEETAVVTKREVSTGKVQIKTHVDTVEEMVRADLRAESVDVTRVPIDKVVDRAPELRIEGDTTIIPICEEVLFVEKRLVLKEELHVRRRVETETTETPVMLRRQRGTVERLDPTGEPEAEPS